MKTSNLSGSSSSVTKIAFVLFFFCLIGAFFAFDLAQYLTFDYLKTQQAEFQNYYAAHPALSLALYFVVYVLVTAISLPGATILTLAAGALFGLGTGLIVVSFASSLGATCAFVVARFILKESVQSRFGNRLSAINRGIQREGGFYLFTLRLIPVFPFFVINLVMGLTPIKVWQFYWVSQLGMLPGTFVYINAGTELGQIDSLRGILSPGLLVSFALLGLFPLLAKKFIEYLKARNFRKTHNAPRHFDYNIIVIGAGSGGLVSAYIAAAVKAKVALIEKDKMGGDCLNTGCVPSKALIRSAKILNYIKRAKEFGIAKAHAEFEFSDIMERVQGVIQKVEPHDSVERYKSFGVNCFKGEAQIRSPFAVEINGQILTTRNIIVATGARPLVPKIPGLEHIKYLTSDNIWNLRKRPERLLVLGGGPIGSELAQGFARLGSQVTQVERNSQIMSREDDEICQIVQDQFTREGITVLTSHEVKEFVVSPNSKDGNSKYAVCNHEGKEVRIEFDEVLLALGRQANITGFGLEKLGVQLTPRRTVEANDFLQTNFPNIYVVGDVTGPYQFTHTAAHQAWFASVNALFSPFVKFRVDYRVIPWATFTDPEVARVGLNEKEAKAQKVAYEITTYGIDDLDRAIADSEDHGCIKVLTAPGQDKILGVTIVGHHASDLINEFIIAMKHGLGLNKILGTIHIYPTLTEANKFVAGNWKKAHAPKKALLWVEKFHSWRRGTPREELKRPSLAK